MSDTRKDKINEPMGPVELGDKIKGAFHYVHGLGENVRGSLLGAADSVVHSEDSRYGTTQARGREEMEEGREAMKGLRPLTNRSVSTGSRSRRHGSRSREPRGHTPLQGATSAETHQPPPAPETQPGSFSADEKHENPPISTASVRRNEKGRVFGAPPLPPRQEGLSQDTRTDPGPSSQQNPEVLYRDDSYAKNDDELKKNLVNPIGISGGARST